MDQKELLYKITVAENHIDDLDHVNNVQYLNYVQNAAEKHWNILSCPEIDIKYVWVVIRHEIDYFKSAKFGDELEIRTWIGDTSGVKSDRFVEIKRANAIIAKAKTTWCLLDKKSMRPTRIPSEIMDALYN